MSSARVQLQQNNQVQKLTPTRYSRSVCLGVTYAERLGRILTLVCVLCPCHVGPVRGYQGLPTYVRVDLQLRLYTDLESQEVMQ